MSSVLGFHYIKKMHLCADAMKGDAHRQTDQSNDRPTEKMTLPKIWKSGFETWFVTKCLIPVGRTTSLTQ